jgi:hypothetical protein
VKERVIRVNRRTLSDVLKALAKLKQARYIRNLFDLFDAADSSEAFNWEQAP